MPTKYLTIQPLQEPFDMGPDAEKRTRWAFNIRTVKHPSTTFVRELLAILQTASVGTFGTTMFAGSGALLPTADASFAVLSVIATGGQPPINTHNTVATPTYVQPGAQIVTRAKTSPPAEAMCRAAYAALFAVRNQSITPLP